MQRHAKIRWCTGVSCYSPEYLASGTPKCIMAHLFLDDVKEPENFNNNVPFDLLVSDIFLKLESVTNDNKGPFNTISAKKTDIIEKFVDTWRTHFGPNIWPAVQLIFPNRDGRKYYIKDVALTRLVTKLLGLLPQLADYKIIRDWKKSYQQKKVMAGKSEYRNLGDLPLIVARIMLRRRGPQTVKSTVTVAEVNDTLNKLTEQSKSKDQLDLLTPFVDRLTIPEIRCFFQMILKESMLSFFERAFFIAWHPDAYDLFKVCSDMKKIFWSLTDSNVRLRPDQLCVQLLYQFVPQSSQKLEFSYEKLCKKMSADMNVAGKDPKLVDRYQRGQYQGHFLIEEKIDGDRMLMHMVDGTFKWHTRRRRDYTQVYGENVHLGSLTKHLTSAFHENVHSIVLDGEMVAWSKDRDCLLPFGTLRSAAIQEALKQFDVIDVYEGNNSWPFFLIFDILHLNGRDLLHLPLFYRKELLQQVIKEVPHRFELLQWVKAQTPADIKANMQRIVSERNEGIMVKSFLLKYRVYSRESTWIKVKPEYLENFGENLDLVVVGKIGRVKTSYICGLKDLEDNGCYKLFCMVANGFLNAVYKQIESKLAGHWRDYKVQKPPSDLIQFGTRKPHFWIDPANLIVLEIKARSIENTAETSYAAGSTLHNLWCRAVREDKNYDECITLQEYQELKAQYSKNTQQDQAVNISRKKPELSSIVEKYNRVKRRKVGRAQDLLFQGIFFVVATDYRDADQRGTLDDLATAILQHGGKVGSNPKSANFGEVVDVVVLGDRLTPRLTRWVSQGFDVLLPRWALQSISHGALLPIEPQFITAANNALVELAKNRVDEYGDLFIVGFRAKSTLQHLWLLNVTQQLSEESLTRNRQEERGAGRGVLTGLRFFVFRHEEDLAAAHRDRVARRIERLGGTLCNDYNCHYVVFPDYRGYDAEEASEKASQMVSLAVRKVGNYLGEHYEEAKKLPVLVGEGFVERCAQVGLIVDDAIFRA